MSRERGMSENDSGRFASGYVRMSEDEVSPLLSSFVPLEYVDDADFTPSRREKTKGALSKLKEKLTSLFGGGGGGGESTDEEIAEASPLSDASSPSTADPSAPGGRGGRKPTITRPKRCRYCDGRMQYRYGDQDRRIGKCSSCHRIFCTPHVSNMISKCLSMDFPLNTVLSALTMAKEYTIDEVISNMEEVQPPANNGRNKRVYKAIKKRVKKPASVSEAAKPMAAKVTGAIERAHMYFEGGDMDEAKQELKAIRTELMQHSSVDEEEAFTAWLQLVDIESVAVSMCDEKEGTGLEVLLQSVEGMLSHPLDSENAGKAAVLSGMIKAMMGAYAEEREHVEVGLSIAPATAKGFYDRVRYLVNAYRPALRKQVEAYLKEESEHGG
eukprot:CAMPEP_0113868642 /NCGR_PEP_ID=MMETSP0780_2-20120614/1103_1 /TAXON_ID=652834 /ORGANISM="Palpitomonas bilix" /LENGTH=383 /DNA_ID=CAMNT_0000853749 /DNA_START=151 /DNA_END=1299 /DNA_ORIENTATION=- /assembly_acc=CAM_ASM_000599